MQNVQALALALLLPFAMGSRADSAAIGVSASGVGVKEGGNNVFGWQFSPRVDLFVTSLGLYDDESTLGTNGVPGDGLTHSHPISIWDVTNPTTPLTTSLIPVGMEASLSGGFRYVSVNPLFLSAGRSYVIGALYFYETPEASDWTVAQNNNPFLELTVNPAIQFEGQRSEFFSSSLVFPGDYEPGVLGRFGPNFTFTAVPEPSAVTLGILGICLIALSRKRKKQF